MVCYVVVAVRRIVTMKKEHKERKIEKKYKFVKYWNPPI